MISITFFMCLNVMIGLLLGLTPYISRKHFPFGVSLRVNKETEKIINHQKKKYFLLNFGLSLILSVSIVFLSYLKTTISEEILIYLSVGSLFLLLIFSLVTYIIGHNFLKEYKKTLAPETVTSQKIIVDLSFRDDKLIFPTSYLVGINLAFVALTFFVTLMNYEKIPNTIVMQWDFNMNPTTVTDKSWGSVLSIPLIQLFLTVVMGISNQSFLLAKQEIDRENPSQSVAKNRKFRRQSSLLNFIISILTQILMTAIQFLIVFESLSPKIIMMLSIIFTVIIIGIVTVYSLYYGQSGDRLNDPTMTDTDELSTDMTVMDDSDNHWKLGMFYFNKQDPSFWVEKRMGVGMTFNFAKWQAWVFLLGIILIPFIIVYLTK